MANSKAVGGIIVVIIVIIVAYVFSQENVSNEISIEPILDSSVSITDSATLTQNNPNYEIDEEGNKKYIISVSDTPIMAP